MVFSATFEQHVERLLSVLEALSFAKLTIKPQKCPLRFQEFFFLGDDSVEHIRPHPETTAAVHNFPKPMNKKGAKTVPGIFHARLKKLA